MKMILRYMTMAAAASTMATAMGAEVADTDSVTMLHGVVVSAGQGVKSRVRTTNTDIIGLGQLRRAACCNLSESFISNPSVDVSYSDAATGAKQIKLLGLSGTYVQMLIENIPNLRGASIPYSLGYVPGPWMQSIQVSKGAAIVKNGYESITGQINVEFLKPQGTDGVRANAYFDSQLKVEANVDGSIHLNDKLSASLLLHFENRQREHDGNGDGFMDMPRIRQYNAMDRWAYVSDSWISQLSVRVLRDERTSGMSRHGHTDASIPYYGVSVTTNRYEAQWKNAYMFQDASNSSLALMLHGSWHDASNTFGATDYDVTQKNGYAQLLFESDITPAHNISVGASLNHDYFKEEHSPDLTMGQTPTETTAGVYAQYTFKDGDRWTVMPGIRWDHSSVYGSFVTPRLHIKYTPTKVLTMRAAVGKGYRTPHALAENTPLLACGRTFYFAGSFSQEKAWNYGLSASLNVPVAGKNLELNAEYYYTRFSDQMVIDVDGAMGPNSIYFSNLDGTSRSHTAQIDATYPFFEGFSATAAFRLNDARTTYNGELRLRPLTSRYKGLLTLSYKTPMDIWHFDVTGQLNGRGELYDRSEYPTYFNLQAQITREFRLFDLYIGGENLTNYKMKDPIIGASNPWNPGFDATQVWGPTDGAMAYIGIRFKLEKF